MYKWGATRPKDAAIAHDVLQEAYLDVFKDIKKFKANYSLFSWMNTIIFPFL